MKPPFIRSPYNYDLEAASNQAAIPPDGHGESLTVQSMSEDADINVLMRRFKVTGQLPDLGFLGSYGDFTEVTDFRSALHAVQEASNQFMTLPAELRSEFQNDPQKLMTAISNGTALEAFRRHGLINPPLPTASSQSAAPAASPAPTAPVPSAEGAANSPPA